MRAHPKMVVITGAESTGKSELTKWLAEKFNVPFIPEYARTYIESLNRPYNFTDVEIIAQKQIEQFNSFRNSKSPIIFVDTWLIITKIWFEVVFKKVPPWLEQELYNTSIDLFLVCNTDLPWKPDSIRENGGDKRIILHNKYLSELKKYRFNYKIVSGTNSKRFSNALRILKQSGII